MTPIDSLLVADAASLCGEESLSAKMYHRLLGKDVVISPRMKGQCSFHLANLYSGIEFDGRHTHDVMLAIELYDDAMNAFPSQVAVTSAEVHSADS